MSCLDFSLGSTVIIDYRLDLARSSKTTKLLSLHANPQQQCGQDFTLLLTIDAI